MKRCETSALILNIKVRTKKKFVRKNSENIERFFLKIL